MEPEAYLQTILSPLVVNIDSLAIKRTDDDRGIFLEVNAHKDDMPRLIGRAGATALAIRNLLRVFGTTRKLHVSMKILEPVA